MVTDSKKFAVKQRLIADIDKALEEVIPNIAYMLKMFSPKITRPCKAYEKVVDEMLPSKLLAYSRNPSDYLVGSCHLENEIVELNKAIGDALMEYIAPISSAPSKLVTVVSNGLNTAVFRCTTKEFNMQICSKSQQVPRDYAMLPYLQLYYIAQNYVLGQTKQSKKYRFYKDKLYALASFFRPSGNIFHELTA